MTPHPTSAPERAAAAAPLPADEACKRAIARALWSEIHWLFPRDRIVTVTVRGDDIAVEFAPAAPAAPSTSH